MKNTKAILWSALINPKSSRKKEVEEFILKRIRQSVKTEKALIDSLSKIAMDTADQNITFLLETYTATTKKHIGELQNIVRTLSSGQPYKLEEQKPIPAQNEDFNNDYEFPSYVHYTLL